MFQNFEPFVQIFDLGDSDLKSIFCVDARKGDELSDGNPRLKELKMKIGDITA